MAKLKKTKVLGGIKVAGKKRSATVSARLAMQKGQTKVASSSTRDSEDSGTGVESSAPASSKSYSLSTSDSHSRSDESDSSESTSCVIAGARAQPLSPRYSAEEHNMNRLLFAEEEEPQQPEKPLEVAAPSIPPAAAPGVPEAPVALTLAPSE